MTSYNPTYITIDPLGDLYFGLYYRDSYMGPVVVSNASLVPGGNYYKFNFPEFYFFELTIKTANILASKAILKPENLTIAGEMMSLFFAGESIEISVVGAANASSIPLFSQAFGGFAIKSHFQGQKMKLVTSFEIGSLALVVDPASLNSLTLRTESTITIINPLGPEAPLTMQR